MDDVAEQQEIANEISEAISNPTGLGEDFDEVGQHFVLSCFMFSRQIIGWKYVNMVTTRKVNVCQCTQTLCWLLRPLLLLISVLGPIFNIYMLTHCEGPPGPCGDSQLCMSVET